MVNVRTHINRRMSYVFLYLSLLDTLIKRIINKNLSFFIIRAKLNVLNFRKFQIKVIREFLTKKLIIGFLEIKWRTRPVLQYIELFFLRIMLFFDWRISQGALFDQSNLVYLIWSVFFLNLKFKLSFHFSQLI